MGYMFDLEHCIFSWHFIAKMFFKWDFYKLTEGIINIKKNTNLGIL